MYAISEAPATASLAKYYRLNYLALLKSKISGELRNHVTFTGWVSEQQLHQIYSSAGILVLPSVYREPFGLVITDGMAYGLPVVATRGGGVPEIVVDGKTGLLVDNDDSSQLAAAVSQLLTDNKLRRDMGQAARERAKLFTWNRASERMSGLYEEIQVV
jgi:spore coat protein SA